MATRHRASSPHPAPARDHAAPPPRLAPFQHRLARGDFDAFLGRGLRRMLRGAAADPGLEIEIGAVRLALLRLLDEESDPARLAAGVARLTAVAVQAGRLRDAAEAEGGLAEVHAVIQHVLADLDREAAQRRATMTETLTDADFRHF
jgi:hypothetical protein